MKYTLVLVLLMACNLRNLAPDKTPVLWEVEIDGYGKNVLLDNLILGFGNFYNDSYRSLLAVNVADNNIKWRVDFENIGHIFDSQVTANGGTAFVYIPALGLHIYSKTGELLSKTPPPDSVINNPNPYSFVSSGPTIHNQFLYLPIAGFLFAYDISNPREPKLLWEQEVAKALTALAVDEKGTIYVGIALGNGNGSLQSLDPQNGEPVWEADTSLTADPNDAGTPSAIITLGEKVITGIDKSFTIQAFNRITGNRLYASESLEDLCPDGQGSVDFIEVGDSDVFVSPDAGTCVYGINGETGEVLWTHSAGIDPTTDFTYGGRPKYVNGVVYASNSALWALDAQTGKVLSISSNRDEDAIFTNVQFANGQILVWGKNLTAYKPIR
jgi:outer membrane protein assembly factor BamB